MPREGEGGGEGYVVSALWVFREKKLWGGISWFYLIFSTSDSREEGGGYFLQLSCCESGYFEGGEEVGSACFLSFFFQIVLLLV